GIDIVGEQMLVLALEQAFQVRERLLFFADELREMLPTHRRIHFSSLHCASRSADRALVRSLPQARSSCSVRSSLSAMRCASTWYSPRSIAWRICATRASFTMGTSPIACSSAASRRARPVTCTGLLTTDAAARAGAVAASVVPAAFWPVPTCTGRL